MEQINAILREHNIRITSQRKAILQVLYECRGHHLEIENIRQLLLRKESNMKKIGLATVYRTLDLFIKTGLVSKLSIEKSPSQYELIVSEKPWHHHLICLKCGHVQEIDDSLIKNLKMDILKEKKFQIAEKPMKIYGYCSKCSDL